MNAFCIICISENGTRNRQGHDNNLDNNIRRLVRYYMVGRSIDSCVK